PGPGVGPEEGPELVGSHSAGGAGCPGHHKDRRGGGGLIGKDQQGQVAVAQGLPVPVEARGHIRPRLLDVVRASEEGSMALRRFFGKRCLSRFRMASVWCPIHSSIPRWSTPAAARFQANECL